jgi:predicted dehydrogenase/threonine dehydrogenase-like Zn-dependent dehydrogenase
MDVPRPVIGPAEVLVQTRASVISPGTERAVTALAQGGLLAKARARPDLVRQVVRKARTEGVGSAARAVRSRLGEDLPLGYSAAGVAVEVGEHVEGVVPGQLVATGGAGHANHAEFQAVGGLLCVPVPAGVPASDAAFATVASVALHGLRLADVEPGSRVAVIGLGLVGQLVARLARASGCDVAAIDVSDYPVERARQAGALALVDEGEATTETVRDWSRGRGADAVILAAATPSSDVVMRATALARDRGTIVVVGDIGLDLDRRPFYDRELTLRFARSYGPGRYERTYEEWGVDYPPGLVRWTEGRNLEAVLDLLASGSLRVDDLVTHRFPIAEAPKAYELVESRAEPYLGIQLTYADDPEREAPIQLRDSPRQAAGGVGCVGAGAFATTVLVPAFRDAGFDRFVAVASASGLSARRLAERAGFERAVSGADAVIDDPDVGVVVIATPHDTHAALAVRALEAGKHVWCEKPLALTADELDDVEASASAGPGVLFVGFNRRWSDAVATVRDYMAAGTGPLVITYRVNAGQLPETHWYHDRRHGGRLIGEACHFVDTCAALVGEQASSVQALRSGRGETVLDDDFTISLRYPGGSLASITYASGGPAGFEKEHIDVLGRGRHAAIADFRSVVLDGKKSDSRQDKGHAAAARAFRIAIANGSASADGLASMRTTLDAAAALRGS